MKRSILTEWQMTSKAEDFPLHMYRFPVRDWDQKYQGTYPIVSRLRRLNDWQAMAFHESVIASFDPIQKWEEDSPNHYEERPIHVESRFERELLQRVLLKSLEAAQPKGKYRIRYGQFVSKHPSFRIQGIGVHPALTLQINVDETGVIRVGFHLSHRFIPEKHLGELLKEGSPLITEGVTVVDPYHQYSYRFIEEDERTVGSFFKEVEQPLIQYYQNKNQGFRVKDVSPDTKAVKVKGKKKEPLPFIPDLLMLEASYKQLPHQILKPVSKEIKLSSHVKTERMLEMVEAILQHFPRLSYDKSGLLASKQGYQLVKLKKPLLRFGNRHTNPLPFYGLKKGGVYRNEIDRLQVTYFVDGDLVNRIQQQASAKDHPVPSFIRELEEVSRRMGVELETIKVPSLRDVVFHDPQELKKHLKKVNSQLRQLTVVILEEDRADACYEVIKQELTGKKAIATQVITLKTVDIKNQKAREYAFYNILLGIYGKSGRVQPWVLAQPLHSDCFIGLDVSHKDGKHRSGIVQIIGKDGRMLTTKPIQAVEKGEKISKETYLDLIFEALHRYEEEFGSKPEHVTFHRDGRGLPEEMACVKEIMAQEQVSYDFLCVIKNPQRRMAYFGEDQRWTTIQGAAYIREKRAYLCSTESRDYLGMAQPMRLERETQTLTMEQLVSDVYHLSFMHIGALNKTRLPVTIHYADKSSTFANKGMLPMHGDEKALLFL